MEGHGPVSTAWVRHLIARIAGEVRVTPVIDLNQQIAADAYEIPNKIREAVHLVHPGDVFPFATNTTVDATGTRKITGNSEPPAAA